MIFPYSHGPSPSGRAVHRDIIIITLETKQSSALWQGPNSKMENYGFGLLWLCLRWPNSHFRYVHGIYHRLNHVLYAFAEDNFEKTEIGKV